jgi:hypothetical protein
LTGETFDGHKLSHDALSTPALAVAGVVESNMRGSGELDAPLIIGEEHNRFTSRGTC